jgi:hypothetical protein
MPGLIRVPRGTPTGHDAIEHNEMIGGAVGALIGQYEFNAFSISDVEERRRDRFQRGERVTSSHPELKLLPISWCRGIW